MREIKFRAYCDIGDENKMLYFTEGKYDNGLWFEHTSNHIDEYLSPLMQYTGLKDKNGVGIYEDDIILQKSILINIYKNEPVKDSNHENWYKVFWSEEYSAWNLERIKTTRHGNFGLGKIDWFKISITCIESELIGNIHENPELLTQHKN